MTAEKLTCEAFEHLYERTRTHAVAAAQYVTGSREVAEDAVQEAAVYCLQRLAKQPKATFTESYFIQLTVSRAKSALPTDRPTAKRKQRRELAMGSFADLDRALYGPADE